MTLNNGAWQNQPATVQPVLQNVGERKDLESSGFLDQSKRQSDLVEKREADEIELVSPKKESGFTCLKQTSPEDAKKNLKTEREITTNSGQEKVKPEPLVQAGPQNPNGSHQQQISTRATFFELYKYSTKWEKFIVQAGLFFSLASGAVSPLYAIILGEIVKMFNPALTTDEKYQIMTDFVWKVVLVCLSVFITTYFGYALMQISAERLSFKLRAKYLQSLMRQEIEYFEKQQVEALPSKMAEYFTHIAEGSGEKMGQLLSTLGSTISGVIIGLAACPYYALCLLVYVPLATLLMKQLQKLIVKGVIKKFLMNGKLGGFTQEMLSALKLIISFGKEDDKLKEYKKLANEAYLVAKKSAILNGILAGSYFALILFFSCFSWSLGFAFIKYEIANPRSGKPTTVNDIVLTYQAVMFGLFTVISIQSLLPSVIRALSVGRSVIDVIDRKPLIRSPIDPNDPEQKSTGVTHIEIKDGVKFNNVHFRYPTAIQHVPNVLQGASFKIKSGTSTAIVGPSGSGKSTIVQMINRFYDPLSGDITYGTTLLKNIDLPSLRQMIGWVGQEPVLIVGTIRENLLYGNRDASEADIDRAISLANAQFIFQMEKGLDTYVGSSTVLNLSGGQKQRIAIARALIKKPQILVLDEATSALDPKSEAEVQNAIVNVQKQQMGQLTIIMIAHRLQTIMTADNLLYLEDPKNIIAGKKGTKEYEEIMDRMKRTNYAHQVDMVEKELPVSDESVEDKDDVDSQQSKQSNLSVGKRMTKEERIESNLIAQQMKRDLNLTPGQRAAQKALEDSKQSKLETKFVSKNAGWKRILSYYKPNWVIFVMLILSAVNSCAMPFIGYIITQLQWAYYSSKTNPDWEYESAKYLIIMACYILCIGFVGAAEKMLFSVMGEKLTYTLRVSLIEEIMHKQISWFDREDRASGIITSIVSSNITSLNGMTTEVLVTLFELLAVCVVGITIGAFICWQSAVLCIICSPIMILGLYFMATMQWGNKGGRFTDSEQGIDNYERSNALLSDVIINYRTVISLGQKNVDSITEKFQSLLVGPMETVIKQSNKAGLFYAIGNSGRVTYVSLVFFLSIELLVVRWGINSQDVFTANFILFFTFMSLGQQASNVPSISKAKAAAIPVFSMIDEPSVLDVRRPVGRDIKKIENGKIEFIKCNFSYPTRAQKVMNNFNLLIPAGSKIALVGHSGCGKSTLTNILLGFYNMGEGLVLIDDKPLDRYDVLALREQCGYVMQEPILFNADIRSNILFGKPDASDEEVYIAAQKANALQFIETNLEELTKEQKLEKLEKNLEESFSKHSSKYLSLAGLYVEFKEKPEEVKQLIFDVMNSMSDSFLKKADNRVSDFKLAIETAAAKYGACWEDVIFHLEWKDEYVAILENSQLSDEVKSAVKSVAESSKQYGQFNQATVSRWVASGQKGSFSDHVEKELSDYRKDIVYERYNALQFMAIDRMRDADGKFNLHKGFLKDCGLKGSKLSGGQKQRIAIARALIKNPRILILDEATSALDEKSQEIVQQALDRAMEGRTSIVIAHRLSTIRNCDILFVLGNGRVLEQGSYDELTADQNSHFNVLKAGMEN